jgi:2-polyprenyl-3-methyl-5-hydroxy-6-metoxy-1,4-benzoquinol methylase
MMSGLGYGKPWNGIGGSWRNASLQGRFPESDRALLVCARPFRALRAATRPCLWHNKHLGASSSVRRLSTMSSHSERLQRELAFQTLQADKERASLTRTSDAVVERYRACRNWRRNRVECVVRFLTMGGPARICDFGCGSGEMACRLGRMGYHVVGLDVSPELIELARQRARIEAVEDNVEFVVADAAGESPALGKFDAVLAMSVLHHLPLEEGLNMLELLLEPGGCLALQEPVAVCSGVL